MKICGAARQHATRTAFAIAALGSILLSDVAIAQPEDVSVAVPREIVRQQVGRSFSTGAPIEDVTIINQVAYNDLDLRKATDVNTLNARVEAAASEGCSELDRIFPFTASFRSRLECMRRAIDTTTAQINAALAADGRGYGNADHP
jgi:UrcA family protein